MLTTFANVAALAQRVGSEAGRSAWLRIVQARIDAFAELTGDRQWIHVDAARCAQHSPYRTTVAHGFLTLSLLPQFLAESVVVEKRALTDKLRIRPASFPRAGPGRRRDSRRFRRLEPGANGNDRSN